MTRVSAPARAALVLSTVFVWAGSTSAQTAHRVKDIATGSGSETASLGIPGMGAAPDGVYFGTYSQDRAYAQLWRTDGTASGTRAVRDFGTDFSDTPTMFTSVPSGVVFFAGGAIWKIGVSGDAVEIGSFGRRMPTSAPLALGETVLFVLDGGDAGGELWRSDGTPEGTLRLDGGTPGFRLASYGELTRAGDRIYFSGYDSLSGWSLWLTDGNPDGTVHVANTHSPMTDAAATANGILLFIVPKTDDRTLWQLWRSDGTASGTLPVREFAGISGGACPMSCAPYGPSGLTRAGARVVFKGTDAVEGDQLWSSDGTAAGTRPIAPLPPYAVGFLSAGEIVYYSGSDPEHGDELWRTDGTASGTFRVADLVPGSESSYAIPLAALGERCVFLANALGELWITDGSPLGTYALGETDHAGSYAHSFTQFGDLLLYADRGELWRTDGTPGGTRSVDSLTAAPSSSPSPALDLNGRLLFVVRQPNDSPAPQATLWISDGCDAGTSPLATFVRAAQGGLVQSRVTSFHGEAYFSADDGVHGTELWKTNGTAEGTRLVADVSRPGEGNPYELVVLGDRLLFAAWDQNGLGGGLWATDGASLERLSTSVPGGELFDPVVLGNAVIYLAYDEAHGLVLWRSDGTAAGTYLIEQLSAINRLARLGDRVYFAANDGTTYGLWSSDGSPGGARLVREFAGPFGYDIVSAGEFVYFTSDEGTRLWRSDGTTEGTIQVSATDWVQGLTAVGNRVFFSSGGGNQGGILWTSDGTEAGTHPVGGVRVGEPSVYAVSLAAIGGRLLFSGSDGVHGYEPWVSDGTAEGTRMLADVAPGLPSSGPQLFTQSGGLVYFSADDGVTGRELWAIPLEAIASSARTPLPVARPPVAPRGLPPRP